MSHSDSDPRDSSLDLFLDGLLPQEQLTDFERHLTEDAELRNEVVCQQRIDRALRRIYQPSRYIDPQTLMPAAVAYTNGKAPARPEKPAQALTGWRKALAVAAVLGLVAFAGWQVREFLRTPQRVDPYAPQPWRSVENVYQDELKDGFKPDWVCEPERFARTFQDRLGQAMILADATHDARMVGLAYSNSLSPRTIHMLARVGETPVLVFADRAENVIRAPSISSQSNLKLHRRTVGDLVLFELSPLNEAHCLALFQQP